MIERKVRQIDEQTKRMPFCSMRAPNSNDEDPRVLLGKRVRIVLPDLEGEVEEVIYTRKEALLFKIKCWIDAVPNLYIVERDEFIVTDTEDSK